MKHLIKILIRIIDFTASYFFYRNLLACYTKPTFIFLAVAAGISPSLFIFLEILESGDSLEEIVLEENEEKFKQLENSEEDLETLKREEKDNKLNNAFWLGLIFFTILRCL